MNFQPWPKKRIPSSRRPHKRPVGSSPRTCSFRQKNTRLSEGKMARSCKPLMSPKWSPRPGKICLRTKGRSGELSSYSLISTAALTLVVGVQLTNSSLLFVSGKRWPAEINDGTKLKRLCTPALGKCQPQSLGPRRTQSEFSMLFHVVECPEPNN